MEIHASNLARMARRRLGTLWAASLLALAGAGCSTPEPPAPAAAPTSAEALNPDITGDSEMDRRIGQALVSTNEAANPALQPGYMLDITVLASGTPEIEEKGKRVSMEGTLLVPLLGNVKVAGLTLPALSDLLTEAYKKYLRNPQVSLKFAEGPGAVSPWGYVTVLGRVNRPGRVNMPAGGGMSVSMAIQAAGGFAKSAREAGIIVVRKHANNRIERFEVDLRDALHRGEDADMRLASGDVLYVPVRIF